MDLGRLVFGVGARVTARGRLRRVGDHLWLDPPHGVSRVGGRTRQLSAHAIRLQDIDPAAVAASRPDAAAGMFTVTGVWLDDILRVERWAPAPTPPRPATPALREPPCRPPAEGWPARRVEPDFSDNLQFDLGDLEETGAAVAVALFRPRADQAVLVVAAADEAAVERQLRPQLGARLCVVPSRWTAAQVEGVRADLSRHMAEWTLSMVGNRTDRHGQRVIDVRLVRVLPEMARWAADVPAGLLVLEPAIAPAVPQA